LRLSARTTLEDYATHRSYGLDPPEVRLVPPGGFYAWMRQRGKLGGQHKVPIVLTPELEASLRRRLGGDAGRRSQPPALS
jgi:hypothetical protein